MNKQQVIAHCQTVLSHQHKNKLNQESLLKIADIFFIDNDASTSISEVLEHYNLFVEGLYKLPCEEKATPPPPLSMLRDWTRTW